MGADILLLACSHLNLDLVLHKRLPSREALQLQTDRQCRAGTGQLGSVLCSALVTMDAASGSLWVGSHASPLDFSLHCT